MEISLKARVQAALQQCMAAVDQQEFLTPAMAGQLANVIQRTTLRWGEEVAGVDLSAEFDDAAGDGSGGPTDYSQELGLEPVRELASAE